ncbi:MAG: hypothetical protein IKD06_06165 [Clostridia bacterium]|nr:hypothetical protein [Clostridia bacterium]
MEINETMIKGLEATWSNLCDEIKRKQKFKFDIFEAAFSQTFSLLKSSLAEQVLDKRYVRLIATAYLFANINDESFENTCLAAAVLTERMLDNFAFHTSNVEDTTAVYIIESRKEVLLDFNDVNESISKLVKIYEDAFWRKHTN